MPIFVGSAQVQKMYIGSAEISAAANSGSNVLGPAGSFPGITNSSLYLPLKTSIIPSRGSSTPTFTRASAAWSFDNEGKLNQNVPSGCARFKGGRLVRNYVSTTSATLAVAATNTVTLSRAETVTFSMGAGTGTATFSGTSGATGTLTASPSGRTEVTKTCAAGTFIITASVATLVDIQVEIVSGQTDQTASEYVSVGVLSSPYHGAGTVSGADGCKWFPTNKDGSAIPSSTLEGYFAEPQRTNNCLWGRDLTNVAWTKTNITAAKTTTGLDNVPNSATRLTAAATDATITQLLTASTGTRTLSAYIKRVSGSGTISLTRNGGIGWTDITSSLVTGSWVLVQMTSDVGANPTVGIKIGTSGDVIDVDCVQDENGAWATSPILTTTAAVTRNADVLSYASAFDVAQGSALCSIKSVIPINSGSNLYALQGGTGGNASFVYTNSADARTISRAYDGVNSVSSTGNSVNTIISKRCSRWGADLRNCTDGNLGTAGSFDGSMGTAGILYVGCYYGGVMPISGPIREVHIWPTPLTDTQMKQVTS